MRYDKVRPFGNDFHLFCTVDKGENKSVESLQFDISTIRTATNHFSADNKLGEGGFGEVYKVRFLPLIS